MRSTPFQSETTHTHTTYAQTTYDRAVAFGLAAVAGLSVAVWAAVALLIAL